MYSFLFYKDRFDICTILTYCPRRNVRAYDTTDISIPARTFFSRRCRLVDVSQTVQANSEVALLWAIQLGLCLAGGGSSALHCCTATEVFAPARALLHRHRSTVCLVRVIQVHLYGASGEGLSVAARVSGGCSVLAFPFRCAAALAPTKLTTRDKILQDGTRPQG